MKLPCEGLKWKTWKWSSRARVATIYSRSCCLEPPLHFDPVMKKRRKSTYVLLGFTLKLAVFRLSCKNTLFIKSAPLSSRLHDFEVYVETCSKKGQKQVHFARFILKHFGTSSPHLDWTRRDLGVKAAQYSKCAPLCDHLLVFLKSMSRRTRKPW